MCGVCDTCVIGKYTDAIEQLTCLSCLDVQPGTTTDSAAATEVTDCSACLAGQFRSTTTSNCEVCSAGQYIEDVTATDITSTSLTLPFPTKKDMESMNGNRSVDLTVQTLHNTNDFITRIQVRDVEQVM